ncbi:MAG: beta strand repeat-containing protein [Terriglobales bacterium]
MSRSGTIAACLALACLVSTLTACGGLPGSTQGGKNSQKTLLSLTLTPGSSVVPVGLNQRFHATGVYSDSSNQDLSAVVTWSSTNPGVASIDKSGMAVAKQPGTTMIQATSGSVSSQVPLTVPPGTLVSIAITPASPSVPKGSTLQVAAMGSFTDGKIEDLSSSVVWASTDPMIAAVSAAGVVTGVAGGAVTITATSGPIRGAAVLTVAGPVLVTLSIAPAAATVAKGQAFQFAVIGAFSDGTTQDVTGSVAWTVSAASLATISPTGMVSTLAAGTVTITATSGSISASAALTVLPPSLSSLTIGAAIGSSSKGSLSKGMTQQLVVTGSYSDGSAQDVTTSVSWTVSPANIATISPSGLLSALAVGTATITATSGSVSASTVINVSPAALTSLAILPTNPSLFKGGTQQLTVVGSFGDGSTQDMTGSVAWTVSPASVATISNSGMVTALINGTAIVVATSGSISASDKLTVSGPTLVSLVVSPVNPSIFSGKTQQLTASGSFDDGTVQDMTSKVTWSGAVAGVIDLSGSGLVTARGAGTATVTATSGSVSGSDTIAVSAVSLVSIAITPSNPSVPKGETQQLTATGTFSDSSTQDLTSQVTWSGAVSGVLDVSATGLVTARNIGTATITATDGSIAGSTGVTVSSAVGVSLALSPVAPTITVGSIQQFSAVELFSDGTSKALENSVIAWTSANPDIAPLDIAGVATGLAEGTATINASYHSLTGSTTLNVVPITYVETESLGRGVNWKGSYFDQANVPGVDATIRVANVLDVGENVCAMVYVFSADQEMSECCGCKISRNGLLTLSLNNDLTSNPLTRNTLTRGTVQIVSSDASSNPTCNPASVTPAGTLAIWATHIQAITLGSPPPSQSSSPTGSSGNPVPMSVQTDCQYVQSLGSGQGICSCGTGD